ncbi:glutamine-hydrolyzing carbamoyl-phosphate synthase small subunit [Candidatus Peregrinibacteria bacterium]|nr:glutamine-hydrolyzing carbamoyl-phosphate synthase small subunit [Candidatus Peregrinibacteria bacterium]
MASLVLQDGTVFTGTSFGAPINRDGEVVFNTGMAGYPESLTDPSYRGQILVFTYPLIGNYGVPSEELNAWGFSKNFESEGIHVRGVIVAEVSDDYSHHTAVKSLGDWLKDHGIPAITGVDTRALTKKLREHGVMLGKIASEELRFTNYDLRIEDPNELNLVAEVSCTEAITYEPELATRHSPFATVLAYDCGMKRNILRSFLKRGVRVIRVPWDFDLSRFDGEYDGVFFSNGPGDPKTCVPTIKSMAWAIEREIPTFGICLGNQLMALAIGGDTFKLKYGHRGANQPCVEIAPTPRPPPPEGRGGECQEFQSSEGIGGRCIITSQNHGFAVSEELPKDWSVWFRNANDGTVEGIRHKSGTFFSVQFHPEATPGPEDAEYLFDEFLSILRK